jgi:hypothetical protein
MSEPCLSAHPDKDGLVCTRVKNQKGPHEALDSFDTLHGWVDEPGERVVVGELQEPHPPALVLDLAKTIDPDAWLSEDEFYAEYHADERVGEGHARAIHWQGMRRAGSLDRARHVIDDVRRYDEEHHG